MTDNKFFRVSNPLNDTQFDAVLDKLQHDFDKANSKNHDENLGNWPSTFDKFVDNGMEILDFSPFQHTYSPLVLEIKYLRNFGG